MIAMTEDIINMRDWVRAAMDFVSENTIGMSRHWEYTDSVAWFLTEFVMCVMVFGGIMTTLLVLLWMERKLLGRFMDRRGARTSLRSLWVGENGVTAGEWWTQLPFGTGVPIGMVNKLLNEFAGNDHELEAVSRVKNRSYHGVWWLLPGFFQNLADGMKFLTKEHMVPEKADRYVYEIAPFLIIATTVMCFSFTDIPDGSSWTSSPHNFWSYAERFSRYLISVSL